MYAKFAIFKCSMHSDRFIATTPFSAAYFPIIAFFSGDTFKYGLRFPAVSNTLNTSKFTSQMEEDGTSLQSGPFSSGKTTEFEVERFFKYFSSAISIQTITQKS